MEQTLEKIVETKGPDTFVALVPQFVSLNLISQNQADRLKDAKLRDEWFYCGDGAVYGLGGKRGREVFLYLTDFANNPIAKEPEKASQELINNNNFFVGKPTASELEAKASSSNGVVKFNLSKLPIQKENDEWGYVQVSTSKLAEGRDAFRAEYGNEATALFDRIHGQAIYGSNGIGDLLNKEGKDATIIYMLNKEYVQKVLKQKEEGTMVARASFLGGFGGRSFVGLSGRGVGGRRFARGVVEKVAEGDAQKAMPNIMPYADALREAAKIAPPGTPFNPLAVGLVNTIYHQK